MMEKKRMMKTMDGNTAAAYISYAFTDGLENSNVEREKFPRWTAGDNSSVISQISIVELAWERT